MKTIAFGIVFFPTSWRLGVWRREKKDIFSLGPIRFVLYKAPGEWKLTMAARERNITEAVRTGIACQPMANTNDPYCAVCNLGPCSGGPRK